MITRDQVKNSMEARWRRHQTKQYMVAFGIVAVVSLMMSLVRAASKGMLDLALWGAGVTVAIYVVIFLPFPVYAYWKYLQIVKNWERYEIHTVTLDRPGTSHLYNRSVFYTVYFTSNSGKRVAADTRPLWSSAAFSPYQLDEYNNKKVRVLYDPFREEVIVLDLA